MAETKPWLQPADIPGHMAGRHFPHVPCPSPPLFPHLFVTIQAFYVEMEVKAAFQ